MLPGSVTFRPRIVPGRIDSAGAAGKPDTPATSAAPQPTTR
jgi:hypothetical protein